MEDLLADEVLHHHEQLIVGLVGARYGAADDVIVVDAGRSLGLAVEASRPSALSLAMSPVEITLIATRSSLLLRAS